MSRDARGFTLIELLLAVSILGVAVSAIGACLAGGLRVWESAARVGRVERQAVAGCVLIERDFRNLLGIPGLGFQGEEDSMRFPVFAPAGGPAGAAPRMANVAYRWNEAGGALVREMKPFGDGETRTERVVESLESVLWRYYALEEADGGARSWRELAPAVTGFPDRVDMELGLRDGERTIRLRRTIVLPVRWSKHGSADR